MGEGSYYIEIAMTDFCGGGQNFEFLGILRKMMLNLQLLFGYTRYFFRQSSRCRAEPLLQEKLRVAPGVR